MLLDGPGVEADGDDPGGGRMTKKGAIGRTLYVRVTENGKRKYVDVGMIMQGRVLFQIKQWSRRSILKGMPNPGWWDKE